MALPQTIMITISSYMCCISLASLRFINKLMAPIFLSCFITSSRNENEIKRMHFLRFKKLIHTQEGRNQFFPFFFYVPYVVPK